MKTGLRKRDVLLVLLFVLALMILVLAYLLVSNPANHDTFVLPFSESAKRELNLKTGEHVSIWLSAMPPRVSGRSGQMWVINFCVIDPSNRTTLEQRGIAGTGWLYPMSFVAQEEGTYTMKFENTIGGNFDKTIRLSYRITNSIAGIPIEHFLIFMIAATSIGILILAVNMLIVRGRSN
ncbi:MAG: hypothetical protein OEY24_08055 [Candidatus Bathyarchaeota archaeon]|nr:hypothetical protein [Candidatus Bathyarchaeota archaeon]MDH5495635.1 hypothetical protein [Candidatus Bathyarchaeota archaeon]